MKILDQIRAHRNDIKTDKLSSSWGEIINWFKDGELHIDPEYQRLFRWTYEQQTRLIESILLDIPLPPIFLAQLPETNKYEVIDGLQRISTILKFFSPIVNENKIDPSEDLKHQNNISIPTVLRKGALIASLEDYNYNTIPETLIQYLKKSRVDLIIVKSDSTKKARYEVFKRVNTYGTQLSPQEIRNCTARILGNTFPNKLVELSNNETILNALGLKIEKVSNKFNEEMILRLLAFVYSKEKPTHDIEDFLDNFMELASEGKFMFDAEKSSKVLQTFELIFEVFKKGEAFKIWTNGKPSGAFSTNIFDIVATGVLQNVKNLNAIKFKEKFLKLMASHKFRDYIGPGSNTKKKIQGRIDLGKESFA